MSDAIRPGNRAHPGSPMEPTGNPMKDGVGAASWATDRSDRPDLTHDGRPRIQPMSALSGWSIEGSSPDPHGMKVIGDDGVAAGVVADIWVDLAEPAIRYLEVELSEGEGRVLLPMGYAKIHRSRREVRVKSIFGRHFADVPRPRTPGQITLLEEDKVVAYYAGGYRYAEPSRNEPLF